MFDRQATILRAAWIGACSILIGMVIVSAGCKGKAPLPPPPIMEKKKSGLPLGTVVYQSDGGLWLLRKGGKPEMIVGGPAWFPSISPDCSLVAYWLDLGPAMALMIYNPISFRSAKIGEWRTMGPFGRNLNLRNSPCWSASSDRIYFADGNQIWEVAPDGQDLQTVYEHTGGQCYGPSISPDGNGLAFIGITENDQNLWVYSRQTHSASQITSYRTRDGAVGSPAWCPAVGKGIKEKIAFVLYKSEEANIWTIPPTGGDAIPLTKEGRTNSPWWEPMGRRLAVSTGTQNPYRWQIAFIVFEDGKFEELTFAPQGAFSPSVAGEW